MSVSVFKKKIFLQRIPHIFLWLVSVVLCVLNVYSLLSQIVVGNETLLILGGCGGPNAVSACVLEWESALFSADRQLCLPVLC